MSIKSFSTILTVLFLIFTMSVYSNEQELKPNLISPGDGMDLSVVENATPTFSWTSVNYAIGYKIVVFKIDQTGYLSYEEMISSEKPFILKEIKGQATSWTPSSIQRMNTGSNYTWYVQAIDFNGTGTWSKGGSFRVEIPVVLSGIEEKLREKLRDKGIADETLDEVFNDLKNEVREVVVIDKGRSTSGSERGGILGNEDTGVDNVIYGNNAGANLVLTDIGGGDGRKNSFFGKYTGFSTSTGDENSFYGHSAGYSNTTGTGNTFTGFEAGVGNIEANYNTFSGYKAGYSNTEGNDNTFLGSFAGRANIGGGSNTYIGNGAGNNNTTGVNNTFIGDSTGDGNVSGSGNIYIGRRSGYFETGSNKLYIENSNSSSPLIYGEFDNDIVTINGKLGIGTTTPAFPLEVHTTGSNAKIVINRTDGATGHFLVKTGFATFGTASNHPLRMNVNNIPRVFLLPNGNFGLGVTTPLHPLHLASGAICTTSGVWQNVSSRDFKENIMSINSDDAFETLKGLEPVTYNYKLEKDELYAGFIAEDVPEMVASKGRKSLGTMDIVAVLTKVVKEQQKKITELESDNRGQKNTIKKIKKHQDSIIKDLVKRLEKLEKK